jgi:RNA polymerase sigma-70 factor (ECF subfamily)
MQSAHASTLNDKALAHAALAGEAAARRLVWLRFAPLVRRICSRFVSRFLEEDDLVQEVFFSVFRSLPGLRDPKALRAFVIAVAIRTGKHHARRARSRASFEAAAAFTLLVCEREAREDVEVHHALIRVGRLLRRVCERDRSPFVLRFVEGMKDDEVAEALAISIPTVRRRCARAHARFDYLAERDLILSTYRQRFSVRTARAAATAISA